MFELVSVGLAYLVFATLPFVGCVTVNRFLLGKEILHSKISKTVPLAIFSPTVLDKGSFKEKNKNTKRL